MKTFELTPHRTVLLSYLLLILMGSIVLELPICTTRPISYLDALFTATSATTVTGLVVLDTEKDLTLFGKVFILFLIQLGGLGYMTFTTYFIISMKRRIGLRERLIMAESFSYPGMHGLVRFVRRIIPLVFLLELMGAAMLFPSFISRSEDPLEAFWVSLFHSVSAFNNAGFSTLSENLTGFRGDLWLNFVISILIFLGGIGFYVIYEFVLYRKGEVRRLSTHTRLVLLSSALFILVGFILLLLDIIRINNLSTGEKLLTSLFHSLSARTAGFNTINLSELSEASQFVLINLMFIGASPGGTGGGVKTVTVVLVVLSVVSYIRGQSDVVVFGRKVPDWQVHKAMVILSLAFLYNTAVALLLSEVENLRLLPALFETVSAFATVGLSLGNPQGLSLSADFSTFGKILIIITMVAGRLGVLGFMLALLGKERQSHIKFPEARLLL